MYNANLKDLAEIRSGISRRQTGKPDNRNRLLLIQPGEYDRETGVLDLSKSARVSSTGKTTVHTLSPDDVLFMSKGTKGMTFVPGPLPNPAVASDAFFVLSPKAPVIPGYLAWFLELPSTRRLLESEAGGSRMKVIRKDALEKIEVPVPPLETQKKIVRIFELSYRERAIMERLAKLREMQVNFLFNINAFTTQKDPAP